jgi:hypothetical protein
MRKWIAMILALAMMVSMCACGTNGDGAKEEPSAPTTTTASETEDANLEQPEAAVNEDVTSEAEDANSEQPEAAVNEDAASEAEETQAEGGTAEYSEEDFYGTWMDLATTYTLNLSKGAAEFVGRYIASGDWKYEGKSLDVGTGILSGELSISKDENGAIVLENDEYRLMRLNEIPMSNLSVGESGSDDTIKVTLINFAFSETLADDVANSDLFSVNPSIVSDASLEDGQVYACMNFEIQNNSKETITIGDYHHYLELILNYDNGYFYSTEDEATDVFTDGTTVTTYTKDCSDQSIEIQPLASKEVTVYMKCPVLISDETETPLNVIAISLFDGTASYFNYNIR